MTAPTPRLADPERYKTLVLLLTVITTVLTTMVAGLSADANIRSSIKNRESQLDAILVAGELHRSGLQTAYDMNVFADTLKYEQEATVILLTAGQQVSGATTGLVSRAQVAQAHADTAVKFSIFYTDSRYSPKTDGDLPDIQAYLTDMSAAANNLVVQQNAAADEYDRWNHKGDAYNSAMAILAVAFFLFGLAQALSPRFRLLFAIFGTITLTSAGIWTLIVLLS
jgi:hypothetical protein